MDSYNLMHVQKASYILLGFETTTNTFNEKYMLFELMSIGVLYQNVIRSELLDGWRLPGEDSTAGSCELFLGWLNIWIHETLFRTRFSGHLDLAGLVF